MNPKQKKTSLIISLQLEGKLCSFYHTIPLVTLFLVHHHNVVAHGLQSIQTNKNQLDVTLVYMPVFRRNFESFFLFLLHRFTGHSNYSNCIQMFTKAVLRFKKQLLSASENSV